MAASTASTSTSRAWTHSNDHAPRHEGQLLAGVDLSRAEAAALIGTRLVTATPEGDGWRVAAEHRVGAVRCGDLDVRVSPKIGPVHVLRLLARAHGIRGLALDPSAWQTTPTSAVGLVCHAANSGPDRRAADVARLWTQARAEGFTLDNAYEVDDGSDRMADVLQHLADAARRTES